MTAPPVAIQRIGGAKCSSFHSGYSGIDIVKPWNRMKSTLSEFADHFFRSLTDFAKEMPMSQADQSPYTDRQKRRAGHIEERCEIRSMPKKEAEQRAWATENRISGGGRKSGSEKH